MHRILVVEKFCGLGPELWGAKGDCALKEQRNKGRNALLQLVSLSNEGKIEKNCTKAGIIV